DKLIHVFLYGVLSFLLVGSSLKQHMYRRVRYNALTFSLFATSVYGVLIELYQEFVLTDRFGDWADALANFVGALLGLILFKSIFKDYIR
ncbi:MAG: VanZ family protein, partial [Bacteroidota bacterium]